MTSRTSLDEEPNNVQALPAPRIVLTHRWLRAEVRDGAVCGCGRVVRVADAEAVS